MSDSPPPVMIDKMAHRKMRNRAFATQDQAGFLFQEASMQLTQRLGETIYTFERALILDGYGGMMQHNLHQAGLLGTKIKHVVEMDCAANFAHAARQRYHYDALIGDAEHLPFAPNSFDLIISVCHLHWMNDLVGTLLQLRQSLKSDGAFFAAVPASGSFAPLRHIITQAEAEIAHRVSPHFLPLAHHADLSALMQRTGFALPVTDSHQITLTYQQSEKIWQDLRQMGESNALEARIRHVSKKAVFAHINARIQQWIDNNGGTVTIPIELIFLHGWAPAPQQQQPQKRGTGQISLGDVL